MMCADAVERRADGDKELLPISCFVVAEREQMMMSRSSLGEADRSPMSRPVVTSFAAQIGLDVAAAARHDPDMKPQRAPCRMSVWAGIPAAPADKAPRRTEPARPANETTRIFGLWRDVPRSSGITSRPAAPRQQEIVARISRAAGTRHDGTAAFAESLADTAIPFSCSSRLAPSPRARQLVVV